MGGRTVFNNNVKLQRLTRLKMKTVFVIRHSVLHRKIFVLRDKRRNMLALSTCDTFLSRCPANINVLTSTATWHKSCIQ